MDLEPVFAVANGAALVAWLLLALLPADNRWRQLAPTIMVALLAVGYVVLIVAGLPGADGSFGSLAGVRALFATDAVLLAGWVHYLAFDLFVGIWIVRDADARRLPRWLVLPTLALTFLLGPAGYLLHLGARAAAARLGRTRPEAPTLEGAA